MTLTVYIIWIFEARFENTQNWILTWAPCRASLDSTTVWQRCKDHSGSPDSWFKTPINTCPAKKKKTSMPENVRWTLPVGQNQLQASKSESHFPWLTYGCPWIIRVNVSFQAVFGAKKTEEKSLHLGSASKTDKFKTHSSSNTFSIVQNHSSVGPRKLIQPCSASLQSTDCERTFDNWLSAMS